MNRAQCATSDPLRGEREIAARRCHKCLPYYNLSRSLSGLPPIGLVDDLSDLSGEPSAQCDACGEVFEVNDAELERINRGGIAHCDGCTDPFVDYEMEEDFLVPDEDLDTELNRCGAEGCRNNPGDCVDGQCDRCEEPAIIVEEEGSMGFVHLCEHHANHSEDDAVCAGTGCKEGEWDRDELTAVAGSLYCPDCYDNLNSEGWRTDEDLETEQCPACGDPMDVYVPNSRPIWSDRHDNIVCEWCATHDDDGNTAPTCYGCGIYLRDEKFGLCRQCLKTPEEEPDMDIFCDDCSEFLGHGSPEAAWVCQPCLIKEEEGRDTLRKTA